MSRSIPHIALAPEKCDQCGRCVVACPRRALRVGGGFIYIDTAACDSCFECVSTCGRGAIQRRASKRPEAVRAGDSGGKVVVGSRAEAKAVRAAAAEAERARAKATSSAARSAHAEAKVVELNVADAAEGRVAWTFVDATAVLAVMLLSLVASDAVMGSAPMKALPPSALTGARAAVLAVFYAVQLSTLAFLAQRHGSGFRAAFGLRRLGRSAGEVISTVGLVVLFTFVTRAASTLWGMLARSTGWQPPAAGDLAEAFGSGGIGLTLALVTVVILGPIAEELAFRGVILRAAGARWGMWPAIVGTAALFSAYHMTAWTVVPLFLLGIALGWLAWTRRSLWAAISLHALYNGVVVAAAYWIAR